MKPQELRVVLNSLIEQKLPVFIWGSPGIGKSSIVKQIAKEKNLEFIDVRLTLLDPTDLKGIPFYNKESNEAVWASPDFLPKDKDSKGILFLDEINSAPPSIQAAAYSLILDRKVGNYTLPDGWAIVAAGNLESDRGVVYHLPSPLANRFVHLSLDVDYNQWRVWAIKSGINAEVIAFLAYDNDKLFTFEPTSNQKAFATPRSWEFVSNILDTNLDEKILLETIAGAVGKEVANSFFAFRKVMSKLPPIDDILEGKEVEFEQNAQILIALTTGLSIKALNATKEQLTNILKFSYKLPKEFAIMLIKDMQQSGIELESLDEFDNWVDEFSFLLE